FNELLVGVTSFFRDPGEWERLAHEMLPRLLTLSAVGGTLRAWVPGCSSGEEAYSLAIVLRELLDSTNALHKVDLQVFATDRAHPGMAKARLGAYSERIALDVSPARLRRFFARDDSGYQISNGIRESVVFASQNLLTDPPCISVDVMSCRNLLIYVSGEA